MTTKLVIIGSGEIGKAIRHVLSVKPDLEMVLWNRSSELRLADIIPHSDFVFLCVPSWAMAEVLDNLTSHLSPKTVLISLAKGVDTSNNKTMDELLRPPFALLAGPMLAEELVAGLPGSAVIATAEKQTFNQVADLFSGTALKVVYSNAVHNTALASVLKNVYALGLGIAEAEKNGDNFKGGYICEATAEMAQACGSAAYTLAGLGDLVATGFSKYSTNRQAGIDLLAGKQPEKSSEGLHSLPYAKNLLTPVPPLLKHIIEVAKT